MAEMDYVVAVSVAAASYFDQRDDNLQVFREIVCPITRTNHSDFSLCRRKSATNPKPGGLLNDVGVWISIPVTFLRSSLTTGNACNKNNGESSR